MSNWIGQNIGDGNEVSFLEMNNNGKLICYVIQNLIYFATYNSSNENYDTQLIDTLSNEERVVSMKSVTTKTNNTYYFNVIIATNLPRCISKYFGMDANEIYNDDMGTSELTNIDSVIIRDMQIVYIENLVKIWLYVVFSNNITIIFNNTNLSYLTGTNTVNYSVNNNCDTIRVLPFLNDYSATPLNYIWFERDGSNEQAYLFKYTDNNGNFVNIPIENSDNFNNFSYSNIMLYSIPTSNNYFYYFICQDNFNNLYLSELTLDISTNSVSRTNTSYNNNGVNNIYNMPNSITSFLNNLYYVRTDLGYSSQQISNLNDSSKYPVYGISNTNPANQQGPTPASSSFVYYLEKNGTLTNYLSFILETPYIPTSNNYNDLSLGLISGSNYIGDNDNLPFKLIISSKDKPGFIYFSNNGGGACFIKDTEITILENNKEINKEVQYLKKGDLVKINENEYKKIVFIGENYYNILDKLNNIRIIKKDTISEHIPFKDTILTSGHSVLFENLDHINEYYNENIYTDNINGFKKMMTQHCKLFNFASLEDIKFLIKGNKIQYYHLALENDDIHGQYAIYTNNIRSESMAISHISISGLREINISPINNKLENLNNNIIKV